MQLKNQFYYKLEPEVHWTQLKNHAKIEPEIYRTQLKNHVYYTVYVRPEVHWRLLKNQVYYTVSKLGPRITGSNLKLDLNENLEVHSKQLKTKRARTQLKFPFFWTLKPEVPSKQIKNSILRDKKSSGH